MKRIFKATLYTLLVIVGFVLLILFGIKYTNIFVYVFGTLGVFIVVVSIWNLIYINLKN